MVSLIVTAYELVLVPTKTSDPHSEFLVGRRPSLGLLKRYIYHLNGALSFLLSINAFTLKKNRDVQEGFWLLCQLPLSQLGTPERREVHLRWNQSSL